MGAPVVSVARGKHLGHATRECPWDAGQPFRGWQRVADGPPPASSYARHLAHFAGM